MDDRKVDTEYELIKGSLDFAKVEKVAKTSRLLSVIFIPFLFSLFVYGGYKLNNLRHELSEMEALKQQSISKRQEIQLEIAELEKQKSILVKEKSILEADLVRALGYSPASNDKKLNEISETLAINANAAIKKMTQSGWESEKDIEVYYYNKTIDEKKIVVGLQALGYKFINMTATRKYMDKKKTNAVWFGSGVPLEDVKVVALALIRAGIQLKGIRPYKNSAEDPSYKNNRIEVGASVDVENNPALTVEEVVSAKIFQR